MMLSSTTKESIKTALALTVAYGIALSLDWQSPYWAGFAVAFCSLDTAGESLNKAFMRIMGTIVAIIVSLALIGLFPQDRWLFMAALITHVGFCTYMMGESRYPYFWLVSGFVVAIIASSSGMDPVNSFELAMLRFQETGLGIVVYTLVSLFLWPRLSFPAFEKSGVEITKIISSLYRLRIGLFLGEAPSVGHEVQKSQVVSTFGNFSKNLEAALTDSLEVQELSKHWRRIHSLIEQIIHILEYRQDSLLNMKNVSLAQLLPGLKEVAGELENRFNAIEQMMAGKLPRHQVQAATLAADQKELEKLSHFQRAAVVVSLERLQRLESLSRNLFQVVAEIRGFTKIQEQRVENPFIPFPLSLDMDNLAAAFRVMLGMFTAYLFWIYLDVPGGQVIVTICGSIGPAFATQPYVKIPAVFLLLLFGCFAAALIYMLLMPQLTSFIGLGIMLFGVTFSLTRLFSTPKTAGLRAITLAIFTVITGISNHQHYAFLAVANTVLTLTLTCTILTIFAYIPLRPGAEHSLNRQLKRYFNSCDHLMKYREP
ncbi:MAG: FUSC family protein, partial [Thermodesulfobacteriota bacterium]|nr:FUSC family protein [Thermodesulfobacteriota bacterium]